MKISIVIIGRNEEKHIDKSVRSVLYASSRFRDRQIVYVDSASTDRTVSIVERYPVKIIRLRPSWKLTSAAGRYLGYLHTDGDYVFFVDGDTVIYKKWPFRAIEFIKSRGDVGGVAGIVHEIFLDQDGKRIGFRKNRYRQSGSICEVNVFGGTAVYRRRVLDEVGAFNPHIIATPELELALRIRNAGYRLFRLPEPMAITYAPQRESVGEILRRARSGLYSMGSTLKYCQKNRLFLNYIKERMGFILTYFVCLFFFCALLLVSLFLNSLVIASSVGIAIFTGVVIFSIRKRSIYGVFLSIFKRSVIAWKTIHSYFTTKVHDAEEYPEDVEVIKE